MFLSFGTVYAPKEEYSSYTTVKGERIGNFKTIYHPVKIEPISKSNLRYGKVKTDQRKYNWTKPDGVYVPYGIAYQNEESLYDIVDMQTGYTIARVFRSQIKETVELFDEMGFTHSENGTYSANAGAWQLNSKRRYLMEIALE